MFPKRNRYIAVLAAAAVLCSFLLVSTVAVAATEITVWGHADWEVTLGPFLDETVERFNQVHPDIKVTFQSFPNAQYGEKIMTALGAGPGPQLFEIGLPVSFPRCPSSSILMENTT
jgi:multiple sugar transport system substrate-binding protein